MNQKSEPVTTSDKFRRRFPTTQALIAYLLVTPPDREVTAQQLFDEQTAKSDAIPQPPEID